MPVPPELAYAGGVLTLAIAIWMAALALIDRRAAVSNRLFDELQAAHEVAIGGERHARKRLDEVRAERDEWKAKYERGEITVAQLREQLKLCRDKQRVLMEMLRRHGVSEAEVDRD